MGQAKILKRDEDLKQSKSDKHVRFVKENIDVDLGSTDCLSSNPSLVPSFVPLLAFFTKKIGVALKDNVTTSALKRILRLDL
ncbi:hypothetical protein Gogos_018525 [Gossypium gossypioides]|uniref:Uncharacterized protein n=1 Tax=Gossypium gossypioides TaxID=34282 RepID=A0A7J9BE59_GOSGO|nr:hypothetical protein [Gossypium gossypioides]